MGRFLKTRSAQQGLPPGSLVHIGKHTGEVDISVIDYSEDALKKEESITKDQIHKFANAKNPTWININGLGDTEVIQTVGDIFDIHPLILEDILNTGQRPKFEEFEKYLYVVFKMLTFNNETKTIESEQVSFLVTETCLISFQEKKGDVFDNVRERIRHGKGRIRKMGTDYLGYSLIDALIDNYFVVLEQIGENVEPLDNNLIKNPKYDILEKIHHYKQELLYLRKVVWPLRDLASGINRSETLLINKQVAIYYRDLYDHTVQVMDTVEIFRDMISGMQDLYLSSISNKMNEIMKVLTIFAAIFIPLTFVAGIYGMNFEYMPELKFKQGYFIVLSFMVIMVFGMLLFFKKKKWL